MEDRLGLMETFVRIVEAGSLSAAAERLDVTQPTVSRRLQALERELGLPLIKRTTHAMVLSDDGERCYERAKEMLAAWDTFEAEVRGTGAGPKGRLRVVAPHAFGQERLMGPVVAYLRENPNVEVDWLLRDNVQDYLTTGIDCGIQVGEVADPSVVAIRVAEVPRVAVCSPGLLAAHPGPADHARDIARLPWLAMTTYYRTSITLIHKVSGESQEIAIRPRLSTDNLYALRTGAVQGLGACVGSAWLFEADLASGALVRLAPEWAAASLPVHLVYPYAPRYPERLRRFVEVMRDAIPASIGGG